MSFEPVFAAVAGFDEKPPMQRYAHGIESGRFDESDIVFGDVGVPELSPKPRRVLGTNQGLDDAGDLLWGAGLDELEHVAFGDQPVPEVDALDGKTISRGVDEVRPLGVDEITRCGDRGPMPDEERDDKHEGAEVPRTRRNPWNHERASTLVPSAIS